MADLIKGIIISTSICCIIVCFVNAIKYQHLQNKLTKMQNEIKIMQKELTVTSLCLKALYAANKESK